jgi:hypothetical protein
MFYTQTLLRGTDLAGFLNKICLNKLRCCIAALQWNPEADTVCVCDSDCFEEEKGV